MCTPDCWEEAPKPEVTARVVGPLDIQQQLPSPPPWFRPPTLTSGPPPLVHLPREAWLK